MQAGPSRPPPPSLTETYHAPLPPKIPLKEVQGLIPRLTTTINDIDSFKALLAHGAQDGTMPNWDSLLSRYSLLLGRITALSASISQLPPPPALRPGVPRSNIPSAPVLSKYLVHPLHPLPGGPTGAGDQDISPLAGDTFFQVINTQLLPSVSASQADLLSGDGGGVQTNWKSLEELKGMDERELTSFVATLRGKLERDSGLVQRFKDTVKQHEEEVDWTMRIGEGEGEAEEEEDDLFRDEEDEKPAATKTPPAPNPREGWALTDYLKFLDTGLQPTVAPSAAQPMVIDATGI